MTQQQLITLQNLLGIFCLAGLFCSMKVLCWVIALSFLLMQQFAYPCWLCGRQFSHQFQLESTRSCKESVMSSAIGFYHLVLVSYINSCVLFFWGPLGASLTIN